MSDIAIRVSNLSKCYQIYDNPRDRLKQFVIPKLCTLIPPLRKFITSKSSSSPLSLEPPPSNLGSHALNLNFYKEFWALKDVSFEIKKGETVGIIGRNGSGKSTLLQMICGTLSPTSGNIQTAGRVAALLELGSGFNPEFTGRENVYLNAAVLGLSSQEIDARFEEVVAFADIGDFIDQPVKAYSSGMYVRLAYAVIAHVGADILIIDEALAVGDVFFRQKCMRHLRAFQDNGGTVVFVSHDTGAVASLCNEAILLSRGKLVALGKTDEICQKYIEDVYAERESVKEVDKKTTTALQPNASKTERDKEDTWDTFEDREQPENIFHIAPFRGDAASFGNGGATILDVWFEDKSGYRIAEVRGGKRVGFCMRVKANQDIKWPAFGFMLKDRLGQYVIAEGTDLGFRHHALSLSKGETALVKFSFLMPILIQGKYSFNVAVAEGMGTDHVQHHWINDAMILHSLTSRLVHGICGVQDMDMVLQIVTGQKE